MFLNRVHGICLIFYKECTQISGLKRSTLKKKIPCPNREAPDCSLSLSRYLFRQNFLSSFWYELLFHNSISRRAFHIWPLFTCFSFSPGLTKRKLTFYESKFGYSEAISILCFKICLFQNAAFTMHLTTS